VTERWRRTISAAGAVLLALGAAAGCGDDDEATTPGNEAADAGSDSTGDDTGPGDAGETSDDAGTGSDEESGVVLEADGLVVAGDDLSFARTTIEAAIDALSQQLGDDYEQNDLDDCGEGPMTAVSHPDLSTYFSDGTLAGWHARRSGELRTADGIGVGSTRRELDDAYGDGLIVEESSLGIEWSGDGVSGTLDSDGEDGTVEDLWAGSTCIAR
jgi:hypothetical protein